MRPLAGGNSVRGIRLVAALCVVREEGGGCSAEQTVARWPSARLTRGCLHHSAVLRG